MHGWNAWLNCVGRALKRGEQVVVPRYLPHPALVGFQQTTLAENVGQSRNWTIWCADGSRLHVHEYADGRLVIHRDGINPEKGPVHAVAHWLLESTSGKATLIFGALAVTGVLVAKRPR